jgi:hypothetical protein
VNINCPKFRFVKRQIDQGRSFFKKGGEDSITEKRCPVYIDEGRKQKLKTVRSFASDKTKEK